MKILLNKDFNTKEEVCAFAKETDISFVKSAVVTALTRFATKKVANAIDYNVNYNLTIQERKDGIGIWFDVCVKSLKNSENYKSVQVLVGIPYYGRKAFVEVIER